VLYSTSRQLPSTSFPNHYLLFCDITPCSPFKVNRRFGVTYRLHLQGRKISQAKYQRESMWQAEFWMLPAFTLVSCLAYFSTLKMVAVCYPETDYTALYPRR
jgi:hypothetical protein